MDQKNKCPNSNMGNVQSHNGASNERSQMDHKLNQSALKDYLKETSCKIQLDNGIGEIY